ncbi:MAG: CCA tRNA nucleotidyltransferase [Geminicoccaceae bacterium]
MTGPGPLAGAPWLRAEASRRLLAALSADGKEARFVGGCVRDGLLDPQWYGPDLDVATQEPPFRVQALLARAGLRGIPTGIEHGTVTALVDDRRYEVTTLRRDVACDGRHAEVAFTEDFEADAARRDLTINAMSCDIDGRVFDPFGGWADLKAGRIRFVGDPAQRIREDYLRILRYFRFYARFGRPPADAAALEACSALVWGLNRLSGERVRKEFLGILGAGGAVPAVALIIQTGALGHVVQGPVHPARLDRLVERFGAPDPLLRLAALLGEADRDRVLAIARRLTLSNVERDRLLDLLRPPPADPDATSNQQRFEIDAWGGALHADRLKLASLGPEVSPALGEALALAVSWKPPIFPVGGADLLTRGVPQGPELGRLLAELRRWWQQQDFAPDREACLARLDALLSRGDGG